MSFNPTPSLKLRIPVKVATPPEPPDFPLDRSKANLVSRLEKRPSVQKYFFTPISLQFFILIDHAHSFASFVRTAQVGRP